MKNLKIDLGCGRSKKVGYLGFDIEKFEGVDKVVDLTKGIPLKSNTVTEVHASHFFEHLYHEDLEFIMREVYRVCNNGAKITIKVPHFSSFGAYHEHHRLFFRYMSFRDYYDEGYSKRKELVKILSRKYRLQKPFGFLGPFFEKNWQIYEKTLLKYLFPCFEIEFNFQVIKPRPKE